MKALLTQGEFYHLKVRGQAVIETPAGRFWLTRSGDPDDYLLQGREALSLPSGTWLVEALEAGVLYWTDRVPKPQRIEFGRVAVEASRLPSVSGL